MIRVGINVCGNLDESQKTRECMESVIALIESLDECHWNEVLKREPEWQGFIGQVGRYRFGPFVTMLLMVALNSYQLKGRAELKYWPVIAEHIGRCDVASCPSELVSVLEPFYAGERLPVGKCKRLHRFLSSDFASWLWKADPSDIKERISDIWKSLAEVMNQSKDAKTIVFAMKCLSMGMLMHNEGFCWCDEIGIPVDSRVTTFTEMLCGMQEMRREEIQDFWWDVVESLRSKGSLVSMVHIDSLVWQISGMGESSLYDYFDGIGVKDSICKCSFFSENGASD